MGAPNLKRFANLEEDMPWEVVIEQTFNGKFCACEWCGALREDLFPERAMKILGPKGRQAFIRCWIMKQEGKKLP